MSKILCILLVLFKSKFKDSLTFLYKIESSIPSENSNPAIPKIKKDVLNKVISLYIAPNKIDIVYKVIQTSSDINNIDIKFFGFKTIKVINSQKIIDQKVNQINI